MGEVCEEGPRLQINRSYLERLSTEELIRMADHYGVDIPPDLERIFVIEQLLELADEDNEESLAQTQDDLPTVSEDKPDFPEQACLPKQYNISFIEVMIRDPLWAFVFWELRLAEKEVLEASLDFEFYYLKVSPVKTSGDRAGKTRSGFSVPVGNDDTAWYLGFPPDDEDQKTTGLSYQVELCAQKGGAEIILVSSAVFRLPVLAPKKGDEKKEGSVVSLASLSGINDFPVLRNGDRQPRMKIRGNSFPE